MPFKDLQPRVTAILNNEEETVAQRLTQVCEVLQHTIGYYDWVGFYFANHEARTLHLKAFAGAPTDHTVIPFGKGICGQVALSNKNFVVQDVTEQDNYISCGWEVKSEIVVPIFKNNENIGQIDIDSHSKSPFSKEDEKLLEYTCEEVASLDLKFR